MARKRSEPAKPRRLRGEPETFVPEPPPSAPPTAAKQWRESVDYFMRLIPLESKTARRQVRRLMIALDHEALEILRIARRLEDPYVSPLHFERLCKRYGRTEIVKQLGRTFAGEHIELAELSALPKRVGRLSRQWREHGGMILDRVEYLRFCPERQVSKNIRRCPKQLS